MNNVKNSLNFNLFYKLYADDDLVCIIDFMDLEPLLKSLFTTFN